MSDPLFDAIREAVNPYVYPGERMSDEIIAAIDAAEAAYNRKCQLVNQLTDEAVKARQPNLGPYWKDVADELRARVAEYQRTAKRAINLDREPRQPGSGGMSTGDMISVGMHDWHRLLRLARWIARDD